MALGEDQQMAFEAAQALEEARDLFEQFTNKWQEVRDSMRRLDLHVERQIDAYMPFTRDQGMGYGPEAWFDMVDRSLEDVLNNEEGNGE